MGYRSYPRASYLYFFMINTGGCRDAGHTQDTGPPRARPRAATQDHNSYEALSWQRTTAGRATRRTSEISHAQAAGWFPKKNHV